MPLVRGFVLDLAAEDERRRAVGAGMGHGLAVHGQE
jgi:hypothetical protein